MKVELKKGIWEVLSEGDPGFSTASPDKKTGPVRHIIKRDGTMESYDRDRIRRAIGRALEAVGSREVPGQQTAVSEPESSGLRSEALTDQVEEKLRLFMKHRHPNSAPAIEEIQDLVEESLVESGDAALAKAYILYRARHEALRDTKNLMLDINETMDGYLSRSDWRVNENANVNFSLGGLILHNSGTITANYWLRNIYPPEVAEAHRNADFHIHDLSMFSGYCAGWSLRQLIEEGLGGVPDKISSAPARHLSTLVQQIVNFLGIMQNEWAGAQAFSSFDTYLAPFVKKDNLDYEAVKQSIQTFIFGVNTPSRWGSQAPFTNITLDWTVPSDMAERKAVVGGEDQNFTYADCRTEMDMINRAFIELMIAGDSEGRGFQYPIPTYNLTRDFDWDSENSKLLFEMTAKYGTPYFQNFINSDLNPGDVRSMCCRLQLDKRELRKRGGGLFGSDEFTGSVGVVTINLPRLGYLSEDRQDFYLRLEHLMDLAAQSLIIKRKVVERLMENGLFPYTRRYLGHLNNHFSTIGIVGMHEAVLNFLGTELSSEEGSRFAGVVLDFMRAKLADLQERTGDLFNLEATPAESTSYRLAKHDLEHFPDIITGGDTEPFYTNSSQLAVDHTRDVFEALDHQDALQSKYTGGTVFHAFLGEAVSDWKACRSMVRAVAHNYRLPYFTISPTFSVCPDHGYLPGEHFTCPRCGAEAEVYSRIVGYYRSVRNWNKGKKEEYGLRQVFTEPAAEQTLDPAAAPLADPAEEQTVEPPTESAAAPPVQPEDEPSGEPTAEPAVGFEVGPEIRPETSSGKTPQKENKKKTVPGPISPSRQEDRIEGTQLSLLDGLPEARAGDSRKILRTAEARRKSVPLSYLLFYRPHCPNCPPVREFMKSLSLEGREINADTAEGIADAAAFGVLAAPTVVMFDHEGDEIARGFSADEIEVMWSSLHAGFENPADHTPGASGGATSRVDESRAGESVTTESRAGE